MIPLWLVGVAVAAMVGGTVVACWEQIRDTVYSWAHANGHVRLERVILRIDTILGTARRLLKVLVNSAGEPRPTVVTEEYVEIDDLPPEVREAIRGRGSALVDVSEQVLTLEHSR